MPDISFGSNDRAIFPTKYHGHVTLSKVKWDIICSKPERQYYRFNGEKVATTLISPDMVRLHRVEANQFFYYKKFAAVSLAGNVSGLPPPGPGVYFTVIIDQSTNRICTVYPVLKPKPGKLFKPVGDHD